MTEEELNRQVEEYENYNSDFGGRLEELDKGKEDLFDRIIAARTNELIAQNQINIADRERAMYRNFVTEAKNQNIISNMSDEGKKQFENLSKAENIVLTGENQVVAYATLEGNENQQHYKYDMQDLDPIVQNFINKFITVKENVRNQNNIAVRNSIAKIKSEQCRNYMNEQFEQLEDDFRKMCGDNDSELQDAIIYNIDTFNELKNDDGEIVYVGTIDGKQVTIDENSSVYDALDLTVTKFNTNRLGVGGDLHVDMDQDYSRPDSVIIRDTNELNTEEVVKENGNKPIQAHTKDVENLHSEPSDNVISEEELIAEQAKNNEVKTKQDLINNKKENRKKIQKDIVIKNKESRKKYLLEKDESRFAFAPVAELKYKGIVTARAIGGYLKEKKYNGLESTKFFIKNAWKGSALNRLIEERREKKKVQERIDAKLKNESVEQTEIEETNIEQSKSDDQIVTEPIKELDANHINTTHDGAKALENGVDDNVKEDLKKQGVEVNDPQQLQPQKIEDSKEENKSEEVQVEENKPEEVHTEKHEHEEKKEETVPAKDYKTLRDNVFKFIEGQNLEKTNITDMLENFGLTEEDYQAYRSEKQRNEIREARNSKILDEFEKDLQKSRQAEKLEELNRLRVSVYEELQKQQEEQQKQEETLKHTMEDVKNMAYSIETPVYPELHSASNENLENMEVSSKSK